MLLLIDGQYSGDCAAKSFPEIDAPYKIVDVSKPLRHSDLEYPLV
jgi:hypothetical protein